MIKVLIGFSKYSDWGLFAKANHIVASLTGNAYFAVVEPTLVQVQAGIDAFYDALNAVQRGDTASTSLKNEKRAALITLLQDLGLNIQQKGENNRTKLLSSGFDITKTRQSAGVLAKPYITRLVQGNVKGSIEATITAIKGAKSYCFEVAPVPVTKETVWTPYLTTRSKLLITGLTQGVEYAFRACGVGTNPTLVYSDEGYSYVA